MVSQKVLKKYKLEDDDLKKLFANVTPFPGQQATAPDPITALAYRIRARVYDGMMRNFQTYKPYYAIDKAFDAPFQQTTPTLVQALASQKADETVFNAAREWDLSDLIVEYKDPKTGKSTKRLNTPTFFGVLVPLVRAYLMIRAAKLTSDRNLYPLFKFDPTKNTPINRARCEIITDRIEAMSTQIGYRDVARQSILKMLMYGVQLQFAQEQWWTEEQEDEDGKTTISREGIRYHLPHPTRTFWDPNYPLSTLNTDNGCEYAGYWRVRRYGDVKRNVNLWNTDKITFGSKDFRQLYTTFFNTVYQGCVMQFPQSCAKWSEMDRETKMAYQFYTSDFDDVGLVLSEYFERLIPKDNGLGDYPNPVWFRFVTAGDGTIVYASALPACPVVYWGYDPDESRSMNASLALEVLPFQDQVGNLLTQALLSVRQNLANLTFVDSDMVDEASLREVENQGEAQYRKLNFLRFSGRKFRAQQQDVRFAFGSVRFPQLDVPAILNTINSVLSILERVLVMSAQEIAGQATHEQSREEIINVSQSTSTRLAYTSMQVDRGWDAWKRQLYAYLMAFGSDEVYSSLSQDPAYTPEMIEALGFTVIHQAKDMHEKHVVTGKKKALQLEYFSATRDGNDRTNNNQLAQGMVQMLTTALGNPMLAQAIGPSQAILLVNQVLEEMGLPRDFKLRPAPPQMAVDEQQKWVQQQLMELSKQVKDFVTQGQQEILKQIGANLKPLADAVKQSIAMGQDNKLAITKITDLIHEMETMGPHQNRLIEAPTPPAIPPNVNGTPKPPLSIGSPAAPVVAQPA